MTTRSYKLKLDVRIYENYKQFSDEVFVISRIEQNNRGYQPKAEADNPYRDLDYSGYHKNRI